MNTESVRLPDKLVSVICEQVKTLALEEIQETRKDDNVYVVLMEVLSAIRGVECGM